MAKQGAGSTKRSVEHKTLAGFALAGAVLLMVIGAAWLAAATFVGTARQVRASMEIVTAYERFRSAAAEVAASQYGWLGSQEPQFLVERNAALNAARQQIDLLRVRIPQGEVERRRKVEVLSAALEQTVLTPALEASATPQSQGSPVWTQLQGQTVELRRVVDAATAPERAIYRLQLIKARTAIRWLYATVAIAAVVMLLALAWLLLRIRLDLRERGTVEQNLQQANRLLESLLESIPAMVFAKDAHDLRFVRVNRTGEQLLGLNREELIGKNDRDFFPTDQADHFIAKDRETLASGSIVVIPEEKIDTRDHGRRTLHTFKVPVPGDDGQPMLLLGISLDITEQKEAERRIVALNEELTRQAQLLQSSNEELESFCYSVSHDLRAPLRAINGYARLLEQDYAPRFDAEGARYLRTICNACDRMAQLIDDLLEFSRIGRQTLELEPVDMEAMVGKVINDAVGGRNEPPPVIETSALPPVRADRNMLQLVWLNLIDNAVKYTTGVNAPRISIEAEPGANEIVYSVTDNGIGFDMQYADKLFGVFQRLHSDARFPGTGVGLAIAQRIVARHGGRIWASSEPGRGSRFSFAMPTDQRLIQDEPLTVAG
jgi:PAS domain S-box-containing protein